MWSTAGVIAILFMGSTLVTPLYLLYQRSFGFSTFVLTLVYSGYVVGNLLAVLFLARISDALGRRPVVLGAIAAAAMSSAAFLSATSTAWLYLGRVLSGLAIALGSAAATAWLTELLGPADRSRAALMATAANFIGLCLGSLAAGCLAQYAPYPLELPFVGYAVMLLIVGVLVATTRETVPARVGGLPGLLAPRIGIPRAILASFAVPAITGFATFSVIGFYCALAPGLLSQRLLVGSIALAGALVSELFAVATLAILMSRGVAAGRAMLAGLALLVPGLVILVIAERLASLPLLIADTALIGAAAGLGYRGSLQVLNQMAPPERRGEVTASYLMACFIGNSVPVIGVGWLTSAHGSWAAISSFAAVVGAFVLTALSLSARAGASMR